MTIDITVPFFGTTYSYLVDELQADWEFDGADEHVALDDTIEIEVVRQRLRFTLRQVFQAASGTPLDPTDLHQEMIYEAVTNDNASTLSFDLNGTTYSPDVYPAPEGFNEARTQKGESQIEHEIVLLGKWYDPNTAGGQTNINSLNSMKRQL